MPKSNAKGGKKHKRGKKQKSGAEESTTNMPRATSTQIYGLMKSRLGGKRVVLECTDMKNRQGVIPGGMWKRVWLNAGDVLLCTLDPLGKDDTCYINYKYSSKEASVLKAEGSINFDFATNDDTSGVEFTDLPQIAPQRRVPTMDVDSEDSDEDGSKEQVKLETVAEPEPEAEAEDEDDGFPQLDVGSTGEDKVTEVRVKGKDKKNLNKGKAKTVNFNIDDI